MECDVPPPLPKNLRNEIAIPEEFVEWERFIPFLTSFTEQVRVPFSPCFTFQCHKCVCQTKCICVGVCWNVRVFVDVYVHVYVRLCVHVLSCLTILQAFSGHLLVSLEDCSPIRIVCWMIIPDLHPHNEEGVENLVFVDSDMCNLIE